MFQRIQTLYLLGVAICLVLVFFLPLFSIQSSAPGVISSYYLNFATNIEISTGMFILIVIAFVMTLIIVFCYKKRKLQLKLCRLNNLLILLFYAVCVYFLYVQQMIETLINSLQIGIILPLIALIFNLLAIRFIKKDEALIKSLNRLR